MIEVFAIMLILGTGTDRVVIENNLHFHNVDLCNYVANALTKRYTSYTVNGQDHATAYCLPKSVKDNTKVY